MNVAVAREVRPDILAKDQHKYKYAFAVSSGNLYFTDGKAVVKIPAEISDAGEGEVCLLPLDVFRTKMGKSQVRNIETNGKSASVKTENGKTEYDLPSNDGNFKEFLAYAERILEKPSYENAITIPINVELLGKILDSAGTSKDDFRSFARLSIPTESAGPLWRTMPWKVEMAGRENNFLAALAPPRDDLWAGVLAQIPSEALKAELDRRPTKEKEKEA